MEYGSEYVGSITEGPYVLSDAFGPVSMAGVDFGGRRGGREDTGCEGKGLREDLL